jgi:hypothetical protein
LQKQQGSILAMARNAHLRPQTPLPATINYGLDRPVTTYQKLKLGQSEIEIRWFWRLENSIRQLYPFRRHLALNGPIFRRRRHRFQTRLGAPFTQ